MEKRKLCVSFLLCIHIFGFLERVIFSVLYYCQRCVIECKYQSLSDSLVCIIGSNGTHCMCAFGLFQIKFTHHLHSRSLLLLLHLSPCHAFLHFQITKATTTTMTRLMHADFCFIKFLLKFNFQRRHFRGGL